VNEPGARIITLSWVATVLFAATAIPTLVPVKALDTVAVVTALVLFAASIPLWLYGFAVGVSRSRQELISISGLFFLHGAAPPVVRRLLLGSFAATLLVTIVTAGAEPFGVLVPVLPLAFASLWASRHGTFAPRPLPPPKRKSAHTNATPPKESEPSHADRAASDDQSPAEQSQ